MENAEFSLFSESRWLLKTGKRGAFVNHSGAETGKAGGRRRPLSMRFRRAALRPKDLLESGVGAESCVNLGGIADESPSHENGAGFFALKLKSIRNRWRR